MKPTCCGSLPLHFNVKPSTIIEFTYPVKQYRENN